MISREHALGIVLKQCDFSLQRHLVYVATAMEATHKLLQPEESAEEWYLTGLLHDIDWNKTISNPSEHCGPKTAAYLYSEGIAESMVMNIQSHCDWLNMPRNTKIRQALVSVDELSGFTVAAALMRPTGLFGMTGASVVKKFKDKAFAKAVSREDMQACQGYFNITPQDLLDQYMLPAFLTIPAPWGLVPNP